MPGLAKIRDITVTTKRNPAGQPPLLFELDKSKLTFRNQNHPGFDVRFKIDDTDGNRYVFPDDPFDAMWAQPIETTGPNACPTTQMHWDGFKAINVLDQNMTLEVLNPNGALHNKTEQLFAFTLRFTLTPDQTNPVCVPFDPIGTNKNGPTLQKFSAATLIVALVVVVAAAFVAYKLFLS